MLKNTTYMAPIIVRAVGENVGLEEGGEGGGEGRRQEEEEKGHLNERLEGAEKHE